MIEERRVRNCTQCLGCILLSYLSCEEDVGQCDSTQQKTVDLTEDWGSNRCTGHMPCPHPKGHLLRTEGDPQLHTPHLLLKTHWRRRTSGFLIQWVLRRRRGHGEYAIKILPERNPHRRALWSLHPSITPSILRVIHPWWGDAELYYCSRLDRWQLSTQNSDRLTCQRRLVGEVIGGWAHCNGWNGIKQFHSRHYNEPVLWLLPPASFLTCVWVMAIDLYILTKSYAGTDRGLRE